MLYKLARSKVCSNEISRRKNLNETTETKVIHLHDMYAEVIRTSALHSPDHVHSEREKRCKRNRPL